MSGRRTPWLYSRCLRALPADFRARNRAAMEQALEDLLREARADRGFLGASVALAGECGDVLLAGAKMRLAALGGGLILDVRVALRSFVRRPGFSVVVLLTLALGIGANTAIFSVVSGVLLKPLPYPEPDRIVRFIGTYEGGSVGPYVSYQDFYDVRQQASAFSAAAAYRPWGATVVGEGEPERLDAMMVSAGFFGVLGIDAGLGRTFLAEEDMDGQDRVVVLSHGLWERRFGADSSVVGTFLTLNGNAHTIVGVAPERFAAGLPGVGGAELWRPLGWGGVPEADLPYRGNESYLAVARLADGATLNRAEAEVAAIMAGIAETHPRTNEGQSMTLDPLHAHAVADADSALWLLLGAVGLVLAIAVANVGNLLLGRAIDREAELALRAALGAGRLRIVRQLLVEGLMLSGAGALIGLGLAAVGTERVVALGAGSIPLASEIALDLRVLAFTAAVGVLAGLAVGLGPALLLEAKDLQGALQAGGARGATSGRRQLRLRGLMVVSQVALSVILLVGAGLLVRSFDKLAGVDPGVRTGVLTFRLSARNARYDSDEALAAFYSDVEQQLAAVPGVRRVAFTSGLPMTGRSTCGTLFAEEEPDRFAGQDMCAEARAVSPDYFEVLGIPILTGRGLEDTDDAESPSVVVINRTTAELLWPGQDPIGHRLATGLGGDDLNGFELFRVVGVVDDVKQFRLDENAPPQTYLSLMQWARTSRNVIVEGQGDVATLIPALRRAVWAVDDEMPLTEVGVLDEFVDQTLAGPRFRTILIASFAVLALILAVVGLYGVVSYSVTQRRKEIAVRLAMGAARGRVVGLVLRDGMRIVLPGIGVGVMGALVASQVLATLLYGVSPRDPLSFTAVSVTMFAVAALASWVPARRAVRVDPASALREE